jgi:hypothetical protein
VALAIGVNALYLLPLLTGRSQSPREPVTPAMLWILAALESRPAARRSMPARTSRAQVIAVIPDQALPAAAESPELELPHEPDTTALPWFDTQAEAAKAAADLLRKEEQNNRNAGSAEEQAAARPHDPSRIPRKAGQYEQLENGVDILWYSDLCYYEFDPAQGSRFRTVCKVRSMSKRQSAERAAALERAVKEKRSGAWPQEEHGSRLRIP